MDTSPWRRGRRGVCREGREGRHAPLVVDEGSFPAHAAQWSPGLCRWSTEVEARLKWAAAHLPPAGLTASGVPVSEERQCPGASPRRVDVGAGGADKVSSPFSAHKASSGTFQPQGAVLITVCRALL